MKVNQLVPENVDQYIGEFPSEVQVILQNMREVIKSTAPEAEECISYMMPTYKLNGTLVHFAAFKNHIGFYATPTGHKEFEKELAGYKQGKGSVQFPLNKPIPYQLIKDIVAFRVEDNLRKKVKSGQRGKK